MTPTTAELTRAAHDAHVASIPDADLIHEPTDEPPPTAKQLARMTGGAQTYRAPTVATIDEDDPLTWCLP
jgi:hypothetical protein